MVFFCFLIVLSLKKKMIKMKYLFTFCVWMIATGIKFKSFFSSYFFLFVFSFVCWLIHVLQSEERKREKKWTKWKVIEIRFYGAKHSKKCKLLSKQQNNTKWRLCGVKTTNTSTSWQNHKCEWNIVEVYRDVHSRRARDMIQSIFVL